MNHLEAKQLVESVLPELSPAESLFLRANAHFETNYGRGWREAGQGSHNWGAITMPKPGGAEDCGPEGFAHRDSRYSETEGRIVKYVTCFRAYPDDAAGIRDMARYVFKPNVRETVWNGDLYGANWAMRENRYYLGTQASFDEAVAVRHRIIQERVQQILRATGEPNPFVSPGSGPGDLEDSGSSLPPELPLSFFTGRLRNELGADLHLLRQGSEGSMVALWQLILGGCYQGRFDGKFGPVTEAATIAWQRARGLSVGRATGEVDLDTWNLVIPSEP